MIGLPWAAMYLSNPVEPLNEFAKKNQTFEKTHMDRPSEINLKKEFQNQNSVFLHLRIDFYNDWMIVGIQENSQENS